MNPPTFRLDTSHDTEGPADHHGPGPSSRLAPRRPPGLTGHPDRPAREATPTPGGGVTRRPHLVPAGSLSRRAHTTHAQRETNAPPSPDAQLNTAERTSDRRGRDPSLSHLIGWSMVMGNAARKARKRQGVPFYKAPKTPTRPYASRRPEGLGLTSGAEIMAALVTRGLV